MFLCKTAAYSFGFFQFGTAWYLVATVVVYENSNMLKRANEKKK